MRKHTLTAVLLALFVFGALGTEAWSQRTGKTEKTLEERDPELAAWIDNLVANLQKDHRLIRNSSAQALIAIGPEAAPKVAELRDRGDRVTRNLATRILERIARESGQNLFKDDLGGAPAESVAQHCAQILKLDKEKTESLEKTIAIAQQEERKIRADMKEKMIDGDEASRQRRNLMQGTRGELETYLDQKGVEFVIVRLGWGGKRTLDDNGDVVDPESKRDAEDGRGQGESRGQGDGSRRNRGDKGQGGENRRQGGNDQR